MSMSFKSANKTSTIRKMGLFFDQIRIKVKRLIYRATL